MDPIAYRVFTDGTCRPVYQDGDQQYVFDADGNCVYGVWYIARAECDTPLIAGDDPPADR